MIKYQKLTLSLNKWFVNELKIVNQFFLIIMLSTKHIRSIRLNLINFSQLSLKLSIFYLNLNI